LLMDDLKQLKETCWSNPKYLDFDSAAKNCELSFADIEEASERLNRFAAYFKVAFPETAATDGIVESPLRQIPHMKETLENEHGVSLDGRLYLKMDSHLPISGSIKARGGVYEVLCFAEKIALESGMLRLEDDYSVLAEERFSTRCMRSLWRRVRIAEGLWDIISLQASRSTSSISKTFRKVT